MINEKTISPENAEAMHRAWLETVLEELPIPFFLLEPKTGLVRFANRRARDFTGVPMVGQSNETRSAHPFPLAEEPSCRIARGEILNGSESSIRTPKGLFHFQNFSHLLPKKFGFEETALLTMLDITATNISRAKLKKREAQLDLALSTAKVGFYEWDIPNNRVTFSEQMKKDWMLDPSKSGDSLDEVVSRIHESDRKRVSDLIQKCMDEASPLKAEYRVQLPTGKCAWMKVRGQVTFDARRVPLQFFGTCLDISSQKNHEEQIAQSAEKFKALANSMPQIVWTATSTGQLNYVNERAPLYTGSPTHDTWLSYIHPDEQATVAAHWMKCVTERIPYEIEFRLLRLDGVYRWHLVRALPGLKPNEEDDTFWYGTCTDVTEHKILQTEILKARREAEAASDAKSAFLANMSHEIRTPLGAILGFTDLLKADNVDPENRRRYLDVIQKNGKALTRIIDDILDLSKVEAGKLSIENCDFDPRKFLEEITDMFAESSIAKNIYIHFTVDPAVPQRLHSDPIRIRQVLINLIGNAVKFTEEGGIDVQCFIRKAERDELIFTVRDTGTGLCPDQRDRLFQPFTQADQSTSRKFGGTGLGLVLSQRLARAMNGDVTILQCDLNKGCTFEASFQVFPALNASKAANDVSLRNFKEEDKLLSGRRMLVIDDSADNLFLVRGILSKHGATVSTADRASRGIEMALSEAFDLIYMDLQMPQMDGYAAMAALQASHYTRPVAALTAHALNSERLRTHQAGFCAHFTKPIDEAELIGKTVELLDPQSTPPHTKKSPEVRVLVVEDDEDLRRLVVEVLDGEGISCVEAASAESGIDLLKKELRVELILLDLTLPDMTGEDFLLKVREQGLGQDAAIYVCSGWPDIKERAQSMKASGFIRKPYDIDHLVSAVKEILDSSPQ